MTARGRSLRLYALRGRWGVGEVRGRALSFSSKPPARVMRWYSLNSVAVILDVPVSTVRWWRSCGALKVELVMGKLRVSEKTLCELPETLPVTVPRFDGGSAVSGAASRCEAAKGSKAASIPPVGATHPRAFSFSKSGHRTVVSGIDKEGSGDGGS